MINEWRSCLHELIRISKECDILEISEADIELLNKIKERIVTKLAIKNKEHEKQKELESFKQATKIERIGQNPTWLTKTQ